MPTEPTISAPGGGAPLRERLRAALRPALKERDRTALAALRSALAAIENAEAVDAGPQPLLAGKGALGVGAAEAERRVLTEEQVRGIVATEIADRESAADGYAGAGRPERAERLRAEAGILAAHLG